jgi:alpha-ribazole phosphatase
VSVRILLVRHADVGPAARGRFIGATDLPLSPQGRTDAAALAGLARACSPTRCLSSPLGRARETAALALGGAARPALVEELREINFGRWEGCSFPEVEGRDADLTRRWVDDEAGFCFPGGEAVAAFQARMATVARRLAEDAAPSLVVFTHGGVIRTLLCHLLGLPPTRHRAFEIRLASAAAVTLRPGSSVLGGLNLRRAEDLPWPA